MAESFAPGAFYGRGATKSFGGGTFSEVTHDRARVTPDHAHDVPHFCLVLEGSSVEHVGKTAVACDPLSLVYRAAGMTHHDEIGPSGARYFIAELGPRWRSVVAEVGSVTGPLTELRGGDSVWLALRLHREVGCAEPSELEVDALMYDLCYGLAAMRTDETAEPAWLRRVTAVLDERYADGVRLGALAIDAGVHPSHLARTFRRFRGRTVGAYVAGRRVQHACRLLQRGLPADEIAAELGFADQSHLTRVFRALTGTTPGAYRAARSSSTAAKKASISSSVV